MEFIFGVISGVCVCSVIFTIRISSRESKESKEQLDHIEKNKVFEEHRKHKYICECCFNIFSYDDAVISNGKLCCPICRTTVKDNGYYG